MTKSNLPLPEYLEYLKSKGIEIRDLRHEDKGFIIDRQPFQYVQLLSERNCFQVRTINAPSGWVNGDVLEQTYKEFDECKAIAETLNSKLILIYHWGIK